MLSTAYLTRDYKGLNNGLVKTILLFPVSVIVTGFVFKGTVSVHFCLHMTDPAMSSLQRLPRLDKIDWFNWFSELFVHKIMKNKQTTTTKKGWEGGNCWIKFIEGWLEIQEWTLWFLCLSSHVAHCVSFSPLFDSWTLMFEDLRLKTNLFMPHDQASCCHFPSFTPSNSQSHHPND